MDGNIITLYTITHFIIYFIMSFYFPNRWFLIIIFSIVWEIFESFLHIAYNKILKLESDYWHEVHINKLFDIVFNLSGYGAGHLYQKYILHRSI